MRLPRLRIIFLCVGVVALLRATTPPADRATQGSAPVELMALSPDGRRVAYASRSGRDLAITIVQVDAGAPRRTLVVETGREGEPAPAAALRFLRWSNASRLVFAPAERIVPLPPTTDRHGRTTPSSDGPVIVSPIMVFDVDTKQHGTLVDARNFLETPQDVWRTPADLLMTPLELAAARKEPVHWRMPHLDILGFAPGNREQLVIRTHGAYNPPRQHAIDLRTGTVTIFGDDCPAAPGGPQVFDWHRLKVVGERAPGSRPRTIWRDEELKRVQHELDAKFPRRAVELVDWSDTRARLLFRVTGGSDAGRAFVYERRENLVVEILRLSPAVPSANGQPLE